MNRERLERLACLLECYQPAPSAPAFDLRHWGEYQEKRGGFLWLRKNECDTAACAVGLACLSEVFAKDGFRYERDRDDLKINPVFAGHESWRAVEFFFDLTEKQAQRLFSDESYRVSLGPDAAKAVAKRIRQLIAPRKRKSQSEGQAPGFAILEEIRKRETVPEPSEERALTSTQETKHG